MIRPILFLSLLSTSVLAQVTTPAAPSSSAEPSSAAAPPPPAQTTDAAPAPPASAPATTAAPAATFPPSEPLASKRFTYTALPYQADTGTGERGFQYGYNICNSTTEGPTSKCQTAMINSIDDFCLWGPPEPNSVVGNTEGEAVAWCTKPGRGTRIIPATALTGVQFMKTPDYVQVTGRIKQVLINMQADDSGGEMDPHGADQRGNPLGGLLFSNAFPSNGGNNGTFQQVVEWHNFMGGGVFCLKACDPAGPNAARFCEHIFDRIGCQYNAPAAYVDNVFEKCDGENQDFPGIYTGTNGQVSTYTQPPESLGAITTVPYTARMPKSSNCVQFQSSALYPSGPSPSVGGSSAAATASGTKAGTTSKASGTGSSTASGGSSTQASSALGAIEFSGSWVSLGVAVAGAFIGAIGVL